jgi:hypothetical protein
MVSNIRSAMGNAIGGARGAARAGFAWLVEMAATAAIVAAVVGFFALLLQRLTL